MSQRPKSPGQVRTIFGEAKRRGVDADQLHEIVADVVTQDAILRHAAPHKNPESIKSLSYAEAERVIQRLKGHSFVPLRTLQYRRQRAGVKQIITRDQEEKIAALASQRHWSAETLVNFCKRQCGHHPLRTTVDANKVIEALKAMNKREGLWAA